MALITITWLMSYPSDNTVASPDHKTHLEC